MSKFSEWKRKSLLVSELFGERGPVAWLVAFLFFADMTCYGSIVPIMSSYVTITLGRSEYDLSLTAIAYAIGLLFVTPITAFVSDRIGNRKMPMLFGITLLVVANVLLLTSSSYAQIMIARSLQGVSAGITWTTGLSLSVETLNPEVLGSILGLQAAANFTGSAVGMLLAGLLHDTFNPEDAEERTLIAAFIPPLAFAVMLWFFRLIVKDPKKWVQIAARKQEIALRDMAVSEETTVQNLEDVKKQDLGKSAESSDSITEAPAPIVTKKASNAQVLHFWKSLVRDGRLLLNAMTITVTMGAFAALEPVLPLFMANKYHASEGVIGTIYSFMVYTGIVVPPIAGILSDRHGPRFVIIMGLLLLIVSMPLLTLVPVNPNLGMEEEDPDVWWLTPVFILLGAAGYGIVVTPVLPDLASCMEEYAPNVTAQAYAIFNMSWAIGILWGPAFGVFLDVQLGFDKMVHIMNVLIQCLLAVSIGWYAWEFRKKTSRNYLIEKEDSEKIAN